MKNKFERIYANLVKTNRLLEVMIERYKEPDIYTANNIHPHLISSHPKYRQINT